MKKRLLFLFITLCFHFVSFTQSCLPDGIIITNQSQIDSFGINFPGCTEVSGDLVINSYNANITNLDGLSGLTYIAGSLELNYCHGLLNVDGLNGLTHIAGNLDISYCTGLLNVDGLGQLDSIGGDLSLEYCTELVNLDSLNDLVHITGNFFISACSQLLNLDGLSQLSSIGGHVSINFNSQLSNISGLSNLHSIGGALSIAFSDNLLSINGLENIDSLSEELAIHDNPLLTNLNGLENLKYIRTICSIYRNASLTSLSGLGNLQSVGTILIIAVHEMLPNLEGLNNLRTVGDYILIQDNSGLTSLTGLDSLNEIGGTLTIENNPNLSSCAIWSTCNWLSTHNEAVVIQNNAPGCDSKAEVEIECNNRPVFISVLVDNNENCQADPTDLKAAGIHVKLNGTPQTATRPVDEEGIARFGYLGQDVFYLSLPQFPANGWNICQDTIWINPADFPDTIRATFLIHSMNECPELTVNLGMPNAFRGCLVNSTISAEVVNYGLTAENVQLAVVMPLELLDVIDMSYPLIAQNGDTLFFSIDNMPPFSSTIIDLVVHTQCNPNAVLLGQTLCIEAFATAANACPPTEDFSEVHLFSECLDDETVRFTLRNIGNAPTQSLHEYVIIEDEVILMTDDFNLNPGEERSVNVPANGATYRMEATRFDDGTLTALALENCGGLTPGLITAYWLDEGLNNHDYACAEVIGSYDPNQKTAIPKGVGESHLLAANRPLQYTIEFQNTGTDTAFRVLLTDVLSPYLDINTFRPGFSSHPYSWEIRGLDTLNVLFYPIALPDSNVNVAGSQGFFTFDISQKPDLPNGTVIENTASIVFDFNPPIVTNTTFHTIGELVVSINEPAYEAERLWRVFANPIQSTATFKAIGAISGEKRFELFDSAGRQIRNDRFDGQEFLFQRRELAGGLYFFRITDNQGRSSSGKIVIAY